MEVLKNEKALTTLNYSSATIRKQVYNSHFKEGGRHKDESPFSEKQFFFEN